jgi:hypothetical protein
MSVTQAVEIPANHRLTIDVPREVPAGPVILTFTPAAAKKPVNQRSEPAIKNADERAKRRAEFLAELRSQPTPHADALLGILSGLGDITLEQIRDERLAKHLK